jgi:hypothetical protein
MEPKRPQFGHERPQGLARKQIRRISRMRKLDLDDEFPGTHPGPSLIKLAERELDHLGQGGEWSQLGG